MGINIFIILLGIILLSYVIISIIDFVKYVKFEGDEINHIKILLFMGIRIIPLLSAGIFLLFAFPELILLCPLKIFVLLIIVTFEIFFIQVHYCECLLYDEYNIIDVIFMVICVILFIISAAILLIGEDSEEMKGIEYKDSKVETVEILAASDSFSIEGEINGQALGSIHGYIKNDELMYSYYYISDDGKKVLHNEFEESSLNDRIILNEGEDSYIEITTEQYIKKFEKNTKVYNGKKTYTIYAPLSVYSGIVFDAK